MTHSFSFSATTPLGVRQYGFFAHTSRAVHGTIGGPRIGSAPDTQWAVVQCAVPLGIPFGLGILGIISDEVAVWASLIIILTSIA